MSYIWSTFLTCMLLFLPIFGGAGPFQQCKNYSFLKRGFSMDDFQSCHTHLQQCPKKGPYVDQACVKKTIRHDASCYQLSKLAKAMNGAPDLITAETLDHFILIDQYFPADGQHNYYIISPIGCMANTKIDPRNLSPALKKRYKNTLFMIVNSDKPVFQKFANNTASFTVLLKVTKNCLACETVGLAKIRYDFAKNGRLIKTTLMSFNRSSP